MASEDDDRRTSAAWQGGFGAAMVLAMVLGTFAQFVFGALGPLLIDDLGISRAQFGTLVSVFFLASAALSPVLGPLVDAVGGRRTLVVLFTIVAVAYAAMAGAPNYAALLGAVALAGVASAAVNPVTNQLIGRHLPAGRRGTLIAIKQSGVQFGSLLAGAILPPLAILYGWRRALLATAIVAVAGTVAALVVVPGDGPTHRVAWGGRGTAPLPASVRRLALYALLMGAGMSSVGTYIALYVHEVVGMPEVTAGRLLAVLGGVGIVGRLVWTRAAERQERVEPYLVAFAAVSAVGVGLLWVAAAAGAWLVWVAAITLGGSAMAWNALAMLAVIRDSSEGSTGRASGIVLTGFFTGMLVSPVVFGSLVDATGSYGYGWAAVILAFASALLWAARDRRLTRLRT